MKNDANRWNSVLRGLALATTIAAMPLPSYSDNHEPRPDDSSLGFLLDNDYYKVHLNIRARLELADREGSKESSAVTLRTRAGIGTKPFYGLSLFGEVENIVAAESDSYFDLVSSPNGRTPIADPKDTQLNRAFIQYQNDNLLGATLKVVGGRQRTIFDDSRWVGNVGWRQNEQTYDSVLGSTSLGIPGLSTTYSYIWDVHRIFGNEGPEGATTQDFDSNNHLVNVSYKGFKPLAVTGFVYLLDFEDDSPGLSANSYGLRLNGSAPINDKWKANYAASYALQTDAGDNPVNYTAHFVSVDAGVGYAPLGSISAGYELLGSDDGKARVVTPLATLHKFNGFADVFLGNGGARGLQDLHLTLSPKLPCKVKGKVVYHKFFSDQGGTNLGDEIDFVFSRPIVKNLSVLTKGAFFESGTRTMPDIWRGWIEFNFAY